MPNEQINWIIKQKKKNLRDCYREILKIWMKYFHTFTRYRHHRFFVIFQAKSSGELELRYNRKRYIWLAPSFRSRIFLESQRATACSFVVPSGYANVVAPALVGQAWVRQGCWSFSVDVKCPQISLVIQKDFGILSIRKINSDNFFILWVQIVEPSVHYSQGHWLRN